MSQVLAASTKSELTPSTPNPTHEPEDRRPRLGELLTSAGLLTQEQLDECLTIARAEGKPLGHVLVEHGIVRAHSIAMALADQHGGPLKTEYGFAAGSGGVRSAAAHPGEPPSGPPPLLLLPPVGEAPASPLRLPPVAPAAEVPTLPTVSLPAAPAQPEPVAAAPLTTTSAVLNATLEVETAARAAAELQVTDLRARIDELEAAGARAAEEAAAPLLAQLDELRLRLETQSADAETKNREVLARALAADESLRSHLAAERATSADAVTAAEALRAELAGLRADERTESGAVAAAEQQLAAVHDQLANTLADAETLRGEIAAERATSANAVTAAEALRAELAGLRAQGQTESGAVAAAEQQLAAVHDQLAKALAEAETLRAEIAAERATSEHVTTNVETLRTQLQELQVRQVAASTATSAAASAAEEAQTALRDQLATAVADAETLRAVIAIDHAAREQAEAAVTALRAQLDELQAKDAAESHARSSAEEQLETMRRELESALAQAETSSRELDAERDGHAEAAATADELRARVTDLETELRKARVSVVPPMHAEIDELRAVIELQEQALAAADAREQRRPGPTPESTRSYSHEAHLLFALNADGYELFERSGPAPAVGSTVELSDGRTCRVLRVGPSPFPGGQEACAYLELP
jgi:chromosome segregation ATPase